MNNSVDALLTELRDLVADYRIYAVSALLAVALGEFSTWDQNLRQF